MTQRKGQKAFNDLADNHWAIAEKVRATSVDPFHDDEVLPAFYATVAELLEEAANEFRNMQ